MSPKGGADRGLSGRRRAYIKRCRSMGPHHFRRDDEEVLSCNFLGWDNRIFTINKPTPWLKNTKDTVVKITLLSKRYFMVPTFNHHSIKHQYLRQLRKA